MDNGAGVRVGVVVGAGVTVGVGVAGGVDVGMGVGMTPTDWPRVIRPAQMKKDARRGRKQPMVAFLSIPG